jgi:phytoene synthase
LAQEHLLEIIDGMEMDLDQPRYADFKSLQLYCYRVASVVGLLSAEIFGYSDRQTLKYAHDLGIAFQLTNIIRDVGEDARRNRIYLPMDELQQFGVTAADILSGQETENFRQLMAFQIERAQRYYRQAFEHLPAADRKAQRAGLIMAEIYRATLDEVVASGCHVLKERVSLTPTYKLWLALKAWLKN